MTTRRAFLLGSVSTLALDYGQRQPPTSRGLYKQASATEFVPGKWQITGYDAAGNLKSEIIDTRMDVEINIVSHGPETVSWSRLENPFSWSDPA